MVFGVRCLLYSLPYTPSHPHPPPPHTHTHTNTATTATTHTCHPYVHAHTVSVSISLSLFSPGDDRAVTECRCVECGGGQDENLLLMCDGCNSGYHTYCLDPPLAGVPLHDWYCPSCPSPARNGNTLGMRHGSSGSTDQGDNIRAPTSPAMSPQTARRKRKELERQDALQKLRQARRARMSQGGDHEGPGV